MFNGDDHVTTMIYIEKDLKHAVARRAIAVGGARVTIAAEWARVAISLGGAKQQ